MKKMLIVVTLCIIILMVTACGETTTSVEPETTNESKTEKETTKEVKESTPTDSFVGINMDDLALIIVKEACQARWDKCIETEEDLDYINEHNIAYQGKRYGEFHWLKELLTEYNQAEYDAICKYTNDNFNDRQFKDEKLKEYLTSYAEAVEQQLEIGKRTDFSIKSESDKYDEYMNKKCLIVYNIMEEYDLKFDNKYIENVDSIKETASSTDAD